MAAIGVITSTTSTDPFSEYELDLCQELGSVIWQDSVVGTNGFGIAVTLTMLNQLKTALRAYCAALDGTGRQAVRECLSMWLQVRFAAVAINGDIGCVHGIQVSSANTVAQLKSVFQLYVPVMTLAQMSDKRDSALTPGKNSWIRMS